VKEHHAIFTRKRESGLQNVSSGHERTLPRGDGAAAAELVLVLAVLAARARGA
jgi:hypothetical protein